MIKTTHGKVDALAVNGELLIPIVILKNDNKSSEHPFLGFIPGFLMKNVNGKTLEECKEKLLNYLKQKLQRMMQEDEPFPFFPTREEILKDFDNVELIEFIKVKSEKRKQG